MGLRVALAICMALSFLWMESNRAEADAYQDLLGCIETHNAECLNEIGTKLTVDIASPADRALMRARFALIAWASGEFFAGNSQLVVAWNGLSEASIDGCAPRVEAALEFESLTQIFGHRSASRMLLRDLVRGAKAWEPMLGALCHAPLEEPHWLERVAERQNTLSDPVGLVATLDLAETWALDPQADRINYAPKPIQAARLLATFGREDAATKVCDHARDGLLAARSLEMGASELEAAEWAALACYRAANLRGPAQKLYSAWADARLTDLGLNEIEDPRALRNESELLGPVLWEVVRRVSWHDPLLSVASPGAPVKDALSCVQRPTAQCLTFYGQAYVEDVTRRRRRSRGREIGEAGALDAFALFLIGADEDTVGEDARQWLLEALEDSPVDDVKALSSAAAEAGDLIWARRIFYSWYTEGGEEFFRELTNPPRQRRSGLVREENWPLHVAWTIALFVDDLEPAFEPEELADFAQTAWDEGIALVPPLRDIPTTELIDADDRSGEHLINLCFRAGFSSWAAELFTKAHYPERAAAARALVPEAARDCAFARRSVGPLVSGASWFARYSYQAEVRALMLEAAERLTRPHYHVYEDADPAMGGAALAALALGVERGLLVPSPYMDMF